MSDDAPPWGTEEHRWYMRGAAREAAVRDEGMSHKARELRSVFELLCQRNPDAPPLEVFARTLHIFVGGLSPFERWRLLRIVWFGQKSSAPPRTDRW